MRAAAVTTLILLGAALFPTASVGAERCSGESIAAIDQYCELLAGAEESAPVTGIKNPLRSLLPRTVRAELESAGPAGTALLAIPAGAPLRSGSLRLDKLPGASDALAGSLGESRSLAGAARAAATLGAEGEGVSALFRWALLLATLGLAGAGWTQFRYNR